MALEMKYFVLKPRCNDNNDKKKIVHALASRAAMLTYADTVKELDPELAEELEAWVEDETK